MTSRQYFRSVQPCPIRQRRRFHNQLSSGAAHSMAHPHHEVAQGILLPLHCKSIAWPVCADLVGANEPSQQASIMLWLQVQTVACIAMTLLPG
jgi:hypothetical protein